MIGKKVGTAFGSRYRIRFRRLGRLALEALRPPLSVKRDLKGKKNTGSGAVVLVTYSTVRSCGGRWVA